MASLVDAMEIHYLGCGIHMCTGLQETLNTVHTKTYDELTRTITDLGVMIRRWHLLLRELQTAGTYKTTIPLERRKEYVHQVLTMESEFNVLDKIRRQRFSTPLQ